LGYWTKTERPALLPAAVQCDAFCPVGALVAPPHCKDSASLRAVSCIGFQRWSPLKLRFFAGGVLKNPAPMWNVFHVGLWTAVHTLN